MKRILAALLLLGFCTLQSARAESYAGSVTIGQPSSHIAVDPITNNVIVATNSVPPRLKIIDGTSGRIRQPEITLSSANSIRGLAVDSMRGKLYVATSSSIVAVINLSTLAEESSLTASGTNNVNAIVCDSARSRLYLVGNDATKQLVVYNTSTGTLQNTYNLSGSYDLLALDPVTGNLLALLRGSNTFQVITTPSTTPGFMLGTLAGSLNAASVSVIPNQSFLVGSNNGQLHTIPVGGALTSSSTGLSGGVGTIDGLGFAEGPNAASQRVVAVNSLTSQVYVLNGALASQGTVSVAAQPYVQIHQHLRRAYLPAATVAGGTSTGVAIIDLTAVMLSSLNVDAQATSITGLALNTATSRLYALDSGSNPVKAHVFDTLLGSVTNCNAAPSGLTAAHALRNEFYTLGNNAGTFTLSRFSGGLGTLESSRTFGAAMDQAGGLALNEFTNRLYVANKTQNTVVAYDTSAVTFSSAPATTIDLAAQPAGAQGAGPVALAVNPVLNRVYVANEQSNNVSVIFGGSNQVLTAIPVGMGPASMTMDLATDRLFVANNQSSNITVIDMRKNIVIDTLSSQPNPGAMQIADGRLYVASATTNEIKYFDLNSLNALGSITAGNSNNMLAYLPAPKKLFVVSRASSGDVTIINTQNSQPLSGPDSAGDNPFEVLADPIGNRVFVSLSSTGLAVLDGSVTRDEPGTLQVNGIAESLALNPVSRKLFISGGPNPRLVDLENGNTSLAALFSGSRTHAAAEGSATFTVPANARIVYNVNSIQTATLVQSSSGTVTLPALGAGVHLLVGYTQDNRSGTIVNSNLNSTTGNALSPYSGKLDIFQYLVAGTELPTIDAIPDKFINEDSGANPFTLTGITTGSLGSGPTLQVLSNDPGGVLQSVTPGTVGPDGRLVLTVTPSANAFGEATLTVNYSVPLPPSGTSTVSRSFKVTVQPVNDQPTFDIGANITTVETAVVNTVNGFASNVVVGPANEVASQDVLQYVVTADKPDQFLVQPAIDKTTGTLTFTPANRANAAEARTISVQLQDQGGTTNGGVDLSVVKTFTITLTPVADALVVTNTTDSSAANSNSLRDCMERARSGDTITFDESVFDLTNSNAATVISVFSSLPALDDGSVTIDASDRRVTVNGSATASANGLTIASSGNTVRGLSIIGFPQSGVAIVDGANNTVGGSRTTGVGPNGQGLRLSGNGAFGVSIAGAGSTGNVVKGCWIGLDAAGTGAEPNLAGILIQGSAAQNTVGGTGAGEANVLSGNTFEGVTFSGTGTDDNVLIGTEVGLAAVESATARSVSSREDDSPILRRSSVGNGSAGVFLSRGTKNSRVGGDTSSEGNVVANNGGNGVEVRAAGSRRNSAKANRISRNKSGGIALFDNANDGVSAPTFTAVSRVDTGTGSGTVTGSSLSRATARVAITGTAGAGTGSVEVFSDSGEQGETVLTRSLVSGGMWSATVDVSDILNITATFTDDSGNTSPFSVFGRAPGDGTSGSTDTDSDGISDSLESLAGTDANDAASAPATGGTVIVDKVSVSLNFSKASSDSVKSTLRLVLPEGFVNTGATVAVQFADSVETLTLSDKGQSPTKGALAKLKVQGGSTTPAGPATGARLTYSISKKTLADLFSSAGLTNATTDKAGKALSIPVAVAIVSGTTRTVYTGTITVKYKATQGKTGKAAQSI